MKDKKEKKDEYFDIFTPYLEKIEKKEKKKTTFHEIEHINFREIVKETIEIAKKEKRIGFFLGIEIFLTIILLFMVFGFLPWF